PAAGSGAAPAARKRLMAMGRMVPDKRFDGRTAAPWDELAKADAFVLSSAVEGFPNVLLEAMSLGLPCAAFDCPSGPAEMTRGGRDALLVPAGQRDALRDALGR
ncbi:glycosyltransferase, partial [Bordetella pertussis]|uniref:glycosyltransferase n=1 Tax=Bordetella pertussis TaxID=520 RepID=UPI0012B1A890